ncbi:TPA: hypothetical protein N0F65_008678 [Lagenidium giganteum]|uniref:Uncharacterized protein n=1 Tax=Lagenidium giganteum TaxID=4803 RepID=A0AAV2ZAF1_9STRA|nr:TPA: hypothetical protein N0F65_008678 [Lagenidium giganteum]
MDEKGRALAAHVQFLERNVKALEELVAKLIRMREEQEQFFSGVFTKSMEDVAAQEDCAPLAQCFTHLADASKKLAVDTHDVMLKRPEPEILQTLAQIQDWGIVPMRRLLEDRDKALKIEYKLQKEYDDKSRVSGAAREKEKKMRMLSDQKRRVENVNALIDQNMKKFEYFRVSKMKKVMNELARSQAFHHAKGLEYFAVPCASVTKLNPGEIADTMP